MLDKVTLQFQSFLDDPGYADQQQMQLALIKTFARVGPNAEPRFRDECKDYLYLKRYKYWGLNEENELLQKFPFKEALALPFNP